MNRRQMLMFRFIVVHSVNGEAKKDTRKGNFVFEIDRYFKFFYLLRTNLFKKLPANYLFKVFE